MSDSSSSDLLKLQKRILYKLKDKNQNIRPSVQKPIEYTTKGTVFTFNGVDDVDSEDIDLSNIHSTRLVQDKSNGGFQLKVRITNEVLYYSPIRRVLILVSLLLSVWFFRLSYVSYQS